MSFYDDLPRPFLALAPMYEVTDTVFRQVVLSHAAPDLMFTEFVNVDAIQSPGRAKVMNRLKFVANEASLVAQIWGMNADNFYKTAREIADGTIARELGLPEGCNYIGIDLNFCCPAKSEVRAGACTALANNRPLAAELIAATKSGAKPRKDGPYAAMPVSAKARIGFSSVDLSWIEFLLEQKLNLLTVECRTRKEMSKVPAHWDVMPEIVKMRSRISPGTKLVINGDIMSRQQGEELVEKYEIDGAMIGRGIFHDPFVFRKNHVEDGPFAGYWDGVSKAKRIEMFASHVKLFAKTWREGERNIKTLNKFCKVYINGFDGAKEMREQLMDASSTAELLSFLSK